MPRCPNCATDHDDDEPCPTCGELEPPHSCARCGESFREADACPACGLASAELSCETHPDTAAEGRCVVCGRAVCKACQAGDSRACLCADHREVTIIQGWAQVYTTTREFEAQLLRENLLAEGLDARIFSQRDNMLSVDLGELSIVRLLVPAWDYRTAAELIREHMDETGEVSFACPECGEAYEADAESCASCGAVLT